jgi:hypothetical protein
LLPSLPEYLWKVVTIVVRAFSRGVSITVCSSGVGRGDNHSPNSGAARIVTLSRFQRRLQAPLPRRHWQRGLGAQKGQDDLLQKNWLRMVEQIKGQDFLFNLKGVPTLVSLLSPSAPITCYWGVPHYKSGGQGKERVQGLEGAGAGTGR